MKGGGFRFRPADWGGDESALNKAVVETIQEEGEAFATHTTLNGRLAIRACVLHLGTTEDDVDFLADLARRTGARLSQSRAR